MNNKINILHAINSTQQNLGVIEIQPKDIINKLEISHQTIYGGLQGLVNEGLLKKRNKSKYTYYRLTSEGKELLQNAQEIEHKTITEPFLKSMANQLIEGHPEDFNGISYNVIVEYLNEQIKELEKRTLSVARDHFVKKKDVYSGE